MTLGTRDLRSGLGRGLLPVRDLRLGVAQKQALALEVLQQLQQQGIDLSQLHHVTSDSRAVVPGSLFLAYPGAVADGRAYIDQARAQGAAAVIAEMGSGRSDVLHAREIKQLAGHLAAEIFHRPAEQLWMVGVTGTNGKTSCTQWLAQAFALLGKPCGVVGTLGAGMPGKLQPNANTTPDATLLHAALKQMTQDGASACALEVTSIGLMDGRVNGARFDVALFTNLTRDHLDYHGTLENYAAAKARLFGWPGLQHAVINLDDAVGRELAAALPEEVRMTGFSIDHAMKIASDSASSGIAPTLSARDVQITPTGTRFTLVTPEGEIGLDCPVLGDFNVANLLGVAGVLRASGATLAELTCVLPKLMPPPGRMELLVQPGTPLAVVDYAHTPDALDNALRSLRPVAQARGGKLVVVFGCGGDRDAGKRPLMGRIAANLSDRVLLTNDNPRSESPARIIGQIRAGMSGSAPIQEEPDRARAIERAIRTAQLNDVVLIAGKGHESVQIIGATKLPFSDSTIARLALKEWQTA